MTARKQLLIGVVAMVAAIGAYWMLVLSPKREEAARLGDEVAKAEQQVQEAQAQLASYRQAKASYKANYATVARLGKAVPEDDDVRSLMVQLESAADRTEVDFRSILIGGGAAAAAPAPAAGATPPPPGAVVGDAGFMTMPFSFSFKGEFLKLSKFMTSLERFVEVRNGRIGVTGRLLVLDSLTLEPGTEGFPKIAATIGATSYLLPPTEGLTGGATPEGPATASSPGTTSAALTPTTATVPGAK
jgi:hypothetical protein